MSAPRFGPIRNRIWWPCIVLGGAVGWWALVVAIATEFDLAAMLCAVAALLLTIPIADAICGDEVAPAADASPLLAEPSSLVVDAPGVVSTMQRDREVA